MLQTKEIGVKILAIYESSSFNPANFNCNLELSSTINNENRSIKVVYNDIAGLHHVSTEILPNLLVESTVTTDQRLYLSDCVLKAFSGGGWNKDMTSISIEFDPNIGW